MFLGVGLLVLAAVVVLICIQLMAEPPKEWTDGKDQEQENRIE